MWISGFIGWNLVKNISESVTKKATKGRYCSAELFFFTKVFFCSSISSCPLYSWIKYWCSGYLISLRYENDKYLKFKEIKYLIFKYLMLHLKCDQPYFRQLHFLFSELKLKLELGFLNPLLDSKMGFLNFGLAPYFNHFSNSQKD